MDTKQKVNVKELAGNQPKKELYLKEVPPKVNTTIKFILAVECMKQQNLQ